MKEWTGDWSDNSKKWTVRTRAQVDGENKEDGSFFMSFTDFIKFFTTTTICYYQEENVDSFITDQHELDGWAMAKFTLERDNPRPFCITVDQISERFMDLRRDGMYYSPPTKIILTKLEAIIDYET